VILQNGKLTLLTSHGRQPRAAECCEPPKAADLIRIVAVVAAAAVADVAKPVLET
jgi:hypothetical protein